MNHGAGVGPAARVSDLRGQGVGLQTVKVSFWPGVRIHVHIFLISTLATNHMVQSGIDQSKGKIPIWEVADYIGYMVISNTLTSLAVLSILPNQ